MILKEWGIKMKTIIKVEELKQMLEKDEQIVLVDVRFDLSDPAYGEKAYHNGHLPGAVLLDMDEDLSGTIQQHGGAHPLPNIEKFTKTLGKIGVDTKTTVVIYDQSNDMFASRLWWMLDAIGHEKVFMLDGGLEAWVNAGYSLETEIPQPLTKEYIAKQAFAPIVSIERMKEKIRKDEAILIDSRARERYLGKIEPRYHKAGHIPGAKNYFWKDVFSTEGTWKTAEELKDHFATLPKEKEIIVSCGSGVSACPNILALKLAGFNNITLYPGGYSDWISYDDNPVQTKDENDG